MAFEYRECRDCAHYVLAESIEMGPEGIMGKTVVPICTLKDIAIGEVGRGAGYCSYFEEGEHPRKETCHECSHSFKVETFEMDPSGVLLKVEREFCDLKRLSISDINRPARACRHFDDETEEKDERGSYYVVLTGTQTMRIYDARNIHDAIRQALDQTWLEDPEVTSVEALR